MTNPIIALVLVAFGGSNHLFTADYSMVWKNLAFLCLLEIKLHVCFLKLFPIGYSVRIELRNLPLLEDSSQLYRWV